MKKVFKIISTGDVHGMLFPYDFTTLSPAPGSLARVSAYVESQRAVMGEDSVLLLDNGDILQGQPAVYLYNFIETGTAHPVARVMKRMRYDAMTIGNHDIETGHPVYDRFRADLAPIPLLGANVTDISTGEPYFKPYTVVERNGVRFAVLGLLTSAIPAWLPEKLWEGLDVEPMVESARRWMRHIRERESPDVVIGLFHSGYHSTHPTWKWMENASDIVAREVDGFDLIIMGHDHSRAVIREENGTLLINPGAYATHVAETVVTVEQDDYGRVVDCNVDGRVVSVADHEPDEGFLEEFAPERKLTQEFVEKVIGEATGDFGVRDAYFGPSAFMELIHTLQLEISGADISLAAPLSFDAVIRKGTLRMSDMFALYKYENQLCTLAMTGEEVKNHLEMSYNLWTAVMGSPCDPLLKFASGNPVKGDYSRLINPSYNFDSAFGVNYTVDVTRPKGQKICISSMADGTPFDLKRTYRVAVNVYRANGGGELITRGAGISHDELKSRVLDATELDLRYYLMKAIERKGRISPVVTRNWRFVPEEIVDAAIPRDRHRLFA
ncbi:bifunctional UDP-sugar hydrolase/5'-nucleotidase [uncultured Duncaniella sp.]|uniref:bifunctional metallophosphatase/5'-nucleotidase n=1 Tax=uncultured Duncaniella sp. TaxID=2768039 RepID=UPI0025A9D324|nr:bifunctional UDP-sugar hydrolase/5'-nucleotidase [uncultured Duncaniella sp.]